MQLLIISLSLSIIYIYMYRIRLLVGHRAREAPAHVEVDGDLSEAQVHL